MIGGLFLFLSLTLFSRIVTAQWITQLSGTTARFRGVSAVNRNIAWASGSNGTYARTIDGGMTWKAATVPGAEKLDFRDVEAFDANTAYLLSIGEGENSRIYKTTDGGKNWALQFTSRNPKAFFDAIAFRDVNNGIAISDPVDGRFVVIRTTDGGATWKEIPPENIPPALPNEGAFAASGTCLTVQGKNNVWFGTGGAASARVFRSADGGQTWDVADTPILSSNASSGIFSLAFKDAMNGIAVGGDYKKEKEATDNIARTTDGGRTWTLVRNQGLSGFRSAVAWVPGAGRSTLVAVGPAGSDYSLDDGASWVSIDSAGWHALSFARRGSDGWAAGEAGRIAKFTGISSQKGGRTKSAGKRSQKQ
ncbi:MAG TPA: hypothetical protein VFD58_15545 [Blastocatellia bacterium]|nr:hypothetical protein [Blastocatellia bacterium]